MNTQHTPGPWSANAYEILWPNGEFIATVEMTDGMHPSEAYNNAFVLAASPDFFAATAGDPDLLDQPIDWVAALLASYEQLVEKTGFVSDDPLAEIEMKSKVRGLVADVRAAIAKAVPNP